MYFQLSAITPIYRVTSRNVVWPTPVLGQGAYFTRGGRYNRAGQPTVYCSVDPLVAITEAAFHQALDWQQRISVYRFNPMTYPLVSHHSFWCFRIDPPPPAIDLQHVHSMHQFSYPPHLVRNPSQHYTGTRELADEIRAYIPPVGSPDPRPEGIKAPSVRTPTNANFEPFQIALFVFHAPIQQPYENRAVLVQEWELKIEFQQLGLRSDVNYNTEQIDWRRPRIQLRADGKPAVPAAPNRPRAKTYQSGRWYRIAIDR